MINKSINLLVYIGFQGVNKSHKNLEIPKIKQKHPQSLSKKVLNESIIAFIKSFRIFSEKYRNHVIRFNIIFAICNFEFLS